MRALVLVLSLSLSTSAWAGLGSLLGKLGKLGTKTGKVVGKGARVGVKGARVGRGVAAVSGVVAAERAGVVFAHLGDDAARSAGYLARTSEGELLLVTRAGQSSPGTAGLGGAVEQLATNGQAATVYVDSSAALTDDALRALPEDTSLRLMHEGGEYSLRRQHVGDAVEFVVDTASGAIDVHDFVAGAEELDDGDGDGATTFFTVVLVLGVLAVFWVVKAVRSNPG